MNKNSSSASEIIFGISALILLWIFSNFSPILSGIGAACLAIYFYNSGMTAMKTTDWTQGKPYIPAASSAPVTNSPTLTEKMASLNIPHDLKCPSCGAVIRPTDRKCNFCGSSLVPLIDLPQPANFGDLQVGQSIRLAHPKKGELTLNVKRRLYYGELWQEHTGPNVPWTTTGTYFVGLTLDQDLFVLNWQSRFFLLDSHSPLTDMDINRDFAQYARQFAASNQTADVRFGYKGSNWHIDDIGKFRIEYCDGDGAQISPGSIGRFIHASHDDTVLVVEDYQSGGSGGLDTLWQGYKIKKEAITTS
jgi:hypothetical protein